MLTVLVAARLSAPDPPLHVVLMFVENIAQGLFLAANDGSESTLVDLPLQVLSLPASMCGHDVDLRIVFVPFCKRRI